MTNLDNIRQMNSEELAKKIATINFIRACDICTKDKTDECTGVINICECGIKEWLQSEYKEPIKLSDVERVILQNIDKKYKWIARDKDNSLRVFNKEVYHSTNYCWDSNEELEEAVLPMSNLFNFIEKYDMNKEQEPYEISKLLGE